MTDEVHTWRASPADIAVLSALRKAKVGRNESVRIRMGLRDLAREKGVVIPDEV